MVYIHTYMFLYACACSRVYVLHIKLLIDMRFCHLWHRVLHNRMFVLWLCIISPIPPPCLSFNVQTAVNIHTTPSSVPFANTYTIPPLVLGQLQSMYSYGNAWARHTTIDRAQAMVCNMCVHESSRI